MLRVFLRRNERVPRPEQLSSIEEIIVTLSITTTLVVAVVFLFLLSWRAVLIPAVAIPVSLIGTFAVMGALGFSLNMLTLNALGAADSVLIPMQCEYYALEGLSGLLNTIEQLRASINPGLEIEGLLRTMYDGRNNLAMAVSDQLTENFGDRVYRTLVPRNIRVAEAPSHGLPVLLYDPRSKGALAHIALAGEMLRRHEKRNIA